MCIGGMIKPDCESMMNRYIDVLFNSCLYSGIEIFLHPHMHYQPRSWFYLSLINNNRDLIDRMPPPIQDSSRFESRSFRVVGIQNPTTSTFIWCFGKLKQVVSKLHNATFANHGTNVSARHFPHFLHIVSYSPSKLFCLAEF